MKGSLWTKLLITVFAAAGIAFLGYIASFIVAVMGGLAFYVPLVVAICIALAVYMVLNVFGLLRARTRHLVFLSFLGLCLLATAGYELNRAYVKSHELVSEQEVNLLQYAPFRNETKAVSLAESSSYRIEHAPPRLDGATALYPLYSAFVQAVYPEGEYDPYDFTNGLVLCTSTPVAYKNLIAGDTDIIFAAAPSLAQQKEAQRNGVELRLTPIGREAFVFFVNTRNPVTGLKAQQIKDIYSGKLKHWSEVGGSNDPIRAFQRSEGSGSQTMLVKFMGDTPLMTPPQEDVADIMSGIIQQTADYRNYKNALGYSFLFYASEMNRNGEISLLDMDGIKPDKESIRSGEYPFATEFYAVTAGSDNPNIQPFLDWIVSPQGQELVEKTGFTSLK